MDHDDQAQTPPDQTVLTTIVPREIADQIEFEAHRANVRPRQVCHEKLARPHDQLAAYAAACNPSVN